MDNKPACLRPLQPGDHAALIALWQAAGWIDVRQTDTPVALARFLDRNPGCSFGAFYAERLEGAVLAGHDGWRGYLYHMAVAPAARGQGVGRQLVGAAIGALNAQGVPRVHCLVKQENHVARQFWLACGFRLRDELVDFSTD